LHGLVADSVGSSLFFFVSTQGLYTAALSFLWASQQPHDISLSSLTWHAAESSGFGRLAKNARAESAISSDLKIHL